MPRNTFSRVRSSLANLWRKFFTGGGRGQPYRDRRPPLWLEQLEDRTVPAITPQFPAVPQWVSEGPTAILGETVEGMDDQNNTVAGAVQAIAVAPDGNAAFLGTVAGGVWWTDNINQVAPLTNAVS